MRPTAIKKVLNIIVLLDTSGSMAGNRISIVNKAMTELKNDLIKFADENKTIEVKIRVITFSAKEARFYVGEKYHGVSLNDYKWKPITDSMCDGDTPMGEAIDLLYSMFDDTNDRDKEALGTYYSRPLIVLISDGAENGRISSKDATDRLLKTRAGNMSLRVGLAIAYDDKEALSTLEAFAESGCIKVSDNDPNKLEKIIKAITLTSVRTASSPQNVGEDIHKINRENIEREVQRDMNVKLKKYGDIMEF